jgi:hypothetical protein
MSEIKDRVKFNVSVQDVFVMGSAIVTITASFLWLRADLLVLTTKFESFKGNVADNVKKIEEEQTKMRSTLDSIYYEVKQRRNEEAHQDHFHGPINK